MSFALISEAVTRGIPSSNQRLQRRRVPIAAGSLAALLLAAGVIAQQPPQFDDLARQAAAARDHGDLPQAIALYNQAEQLKPDWTEGWFYLGLLQYSTNAYPAAIDAFNHLLQLQHGAPPALALRGLCEFETAAYDDALRDLEEAVKEGAANQPRNEQIIRYHLAQLLTRASRFQDAQEQYQFFAAAHLDDADLQVGLGLAGLRVPLLSKDTPSSNRPLYQAAGAAGFSLLAGDTQEADTQFRQLFTRFPSAKGLHFFYGFLLFPHSPELAIDQFRAEVSLAPENLEAHAMLAFTLMIDGRYAEAEPEAQHVLAVTPDMELAQLALGRSLAETGDIQHATEVLNAILKRDPDNLEAHMGLATIYTRTGNREEALREHQLCRSLAK